MFHRHVQEQTLWEKRRRLTIFVLILFFLPSVFFSCTTFVAAIVTLQISKNFVSGFKIPWKPWKNGVPIYQMVRMH
jgi:hypothetical protein